MVDEKDKTKRGNEKFVIKWVLSNIAGALLGYTIFFIVLIISGGLGSPLPPETRDLPKSKLESTIRSLMLLLPFFITLSTAQWAILRSRVKKVDIWIPASLLGYSVAFFLVFISPEANLIGDYDFFLAIFPGILLGLGIGIMQWLVLKSDLGEKAISWLLITFTTYIFINIGIAYLGLIGGLAGWFLGSLISGFWLKSRTTDLLFR